MLSSKNPVLSTDDPLFDDIRPCRDNEVVSELAKITADPAVVDGLLRFRYPLLSRVAPFILRPLARMKLRAAVSHITNVAQFQDLVADFMRHMIATTTDGVTYEGFDKLDRDRGYLFISNHRDISLDPAFVDMALHENGLRTVRIAIGDNLLKMPAATSLMRLNKSFIVKRSVTSPREKLKEITKLSQYIGLSLREGKSIWIAQREGRAKDGNDRTDATVLKMFHVYGRQLKVPFAEYLRDLNIVPVSISYEFDPGDVAKARELYEKALHGSYHKTPLEDIRSIIDGIKGYKGHVSIVAGEPITGGFETPEELAQLIDRFIYTHYKMYAPTLIAAGAGQNAVSEADRQRFSARMGECPAELKERVLSMYAYPYRNLQALKEADAVKTESD